MTESCASTTALGAAIEGRRPYVLGLVVLLLTGAVVLTALLPGSPPVDGATWALLPLGMLAVAASLLVVRFRAGTHEDSVNLVEAVLAVLLFAYAGWQAVLVTAAAAAVTAVRRRTPLDKSAFNIAQWAFAVSLGSVVTTSVAAGAGLSPRGLVGLVLSLVAVRTANNLAFTTVLVLATGRHVGEVLRDLGPVIAAGWLGGFAANAALGLLYVLAFTASPAAVLLFPVPLVLLHAAYRGYAVARTDRQHLAALHRAAQALSAPVDPVEAVPAFLVRCSPGSTPPRPSWSCAPRPRSSCTLPCATRRVTAPARGPHRRRCGRPSSDTAPRCAAPPAGASSGSCSRRPASAARCRRPSSSTVLRPAAWSSSTAAGSPDCRAVSWTCSSAWPARPVGASTRDACWPACSRTADA